ncbi:hypothetical protein J4731_02990 [Providencia rettgeri]|uniref:Uncharacterized protein n=1 Tax=Providencia rettgeri TaxID=587 RepID=A0A939SSY9_PRORE|nr:hypothetical protein [Providencia rettgeri]MBO1928721.1 hypothetical protein [Providencia rettgeri]
MIQSILSINSSDYFIRPENTVTIEMRDSQEDFIVHSHNFNEFVIVFQEMVYTIGMVLIIQLLVEICFILMRKIVMAITQ